VSVRAAVDRRSLAAVAFEWAIIGLAIGSALYFDAWWAATAAFVVVATRQHALLILYHDAVHGHFATSARVNDFIVDLAVGVPTLMPVELYRPLHLEHHRALGTDRDPERQLLYAGQAWSYRPLPPGALLRQLLGDLLIVNGVRTIAAWQRTRSRPVIRRHTVAIAAAWLVVLASWVALAPQAAILALALWLGPLLTVTQLLQKLRSFAEHSGGPGATAGWQDWTYSWRVGLLGRLTIWPYRINYHREHHEQPALHWHELPPAVDPRPRLAGRSLWRLLALPPAGTARD
jgi:fatty acid desaturase